MTFSDLRHGCLLVMLGAATSVSRAGVDPILSPSQNLEIEYTVNEDALPLEVVELWVKAGDEKTWKLYGYDDDRQSPVAFRASTDGLFGFFVVVKNAAGSSTPSPDEFTEPQQSVLVDTVKPVVQLHQPRVTAAFGRPVMQIRWTAIDPHLARRPVTLSYRKAEDAPWTVMTGEPLANTGRFDWAISDELEGPVTIRVVVRDEAGHRAESEQRTVEIVSPSENRSRPGAPPVGTRPIGEIGDSASPKLASTQGRQRAVRLYAEALKLRDAGQNRKAVVRMREAIQLDPRMTDAIAEMGNILYRLGDLDAALSAYDTALTQQPMLRDALRGAAMVYRQRHNYAAAAQRLRRILRYNPKDGEVWMNLGDIAVFQGDEVLAHDCYQRASQTDGNPVEVVQEAQKRLALMADVTRTYGQNGP